MTTTQNDVTFDFPLESTHKRQANAQEQMAILMAHQNTVLERIAIASGASLPSADWAALAAMTASVSNAADLSHHVTIGDSATDTFTDTTATPDPVAYNMPWNLVDFRDVKKHDGTVVPAIIVQAAYASIKDVQFDAPEAAVFTATGLPAGTYNITSSYALGDNFAANTTMQFTLENAVPAGGQIFISDTTVKVFASALATVASETVTATAGSEGTPLGTMEAVVPSGTVTISGTENTYRRNGGHRARYGYNRYAQSAVRQNLNSAEAAATVGTDAAGTLTGGWWTPQNDFDRPPAQAATIPGFMASLPAGLIAAAGPVEVKTALNTADATAEGVNFDTTYDRFWLPSLEELYVTPQLAGEGDEFEYYKELNGTNTKFATGGTYPILRSYAVNAHSTSQSVRLRSASRGNGYNAWYVSTSGFVSTNTAHSSYRVRPACAVHQ